MRRLKRNSIGLDIGERFIKLVELRRSSEGIILNKFGIKEIPQGPEINREKVILQLISQILSENNIKARNVNISAGGQSVFVRFVKLLHVKEDKLQQTMKFEAQNQIPFPLNEVAWDWSILDGDTSVYKRAVIVAIKRHLVENIASRLKSINLNTQLIDVAPFSLYNCMAFNEDFDGNRLGTILDIGAKTTNLVIFNKGNIWIRSFPIAGDRIEETKDQGVEELIGEVERSLEYYFMQAGEDIGEEKRLNELILTGGGSIIRDIDLPSKLAQRFSVKPRYLDPFRKLKMSKDIQAHIQSGKIVRNQLPVAIGLALRNIQRLGIEINFLKEMLSEKYVAGQKALYSKLSIAMAVLIVISFSIFMRQDYSVKRAKLKKIDEMLDVYRTFEPKIKETEQEKEILREEIGTLYQVAASRGAWLKIFKIISEILPKDVWITDLSGIVSLEKSGIGRLDLTGKALSYQAVNNFVSSLKSSPSFKDVKPISSSIETDINTGEEIVKFSITMDVVV